MTSILEIGGLTKHFGGLLALNEINLNVKRGEIVGIIGPNGAGKTTLFGAVSGFVVPDAGFVRLDGQDITGFPAHRVVSRGLVRSFQLVQVFADMSVLDTVTAAASLRHPLAEAKTHARKLIERIGLEGREAQSPESLSIQDKKKLEMAKCIATEPRVLLLDEVMSGLTLSEAEVPMAIIRGLRDEGMTIILVEHVMPVIMKLADRIVVLNFGTIVAEGTPQEIAHNRLVQEAYFGDALDA